MSFDIEAIKSVYYSKKEKADSLEPLNTLADVADKLGYDYYELCEHLHQTQNDNDLRLHIWSGKQAKQAHIANSQYILDYYLVYKYPYDQLAVIFNYDNRSNIARAIKQARMFRSRLLGPLGQKANVRVPKIEYSLQVTDITRLITFNDFTFNKAIWKMMENGDIPSKSSLPIVGVTEVRFFKPIYEEACLYLGNKDYGLQEIITTAFIRYLT